MTPFYESDGATLYHGDCLGVMRGMADGSVDAVVTDPPYGTKVVGWDESVDRAVFAECLRISRGYCVFFYSNTRLWHILGVLHGLGSDAWVVVWQKPNAMGFERRFAPQWVPIVVAYRGGLPFWGQDLVSCPIVPHKFRHPTPKPTPVLRWLVNRVCSEGDTVFDPFAGSATTGVACLQTGRKFIGCEIDERYAEIGRKRLAECQCEGSLFAPRESPGLF